MKIVLHPDETIATNDFINFVSAKVCYVHHAAVTTLQPSNPKSTLPNPTTTTALQNPISAYDFINNDASCLFKKRNYWYLGNYQSKIYENKNSRILFH